jgi:hypothetical protein
LIRKGYEVVIGKIDPNFTVIELLVAYAVVAYAVKGPPAWG